MFLPEQEGMKHPEADAAFYRPARDFFFAHVDEPIPVCAAMDSSTVQQVCSGAGFTAVTVWAVEAACLPLLQHLLWRLQTGILMECGKKHF